MRVKTSWSTDSDTVRAIENAYADIENAIDGPLSFLLVYYSEKYDGDVIAKRLKALAGNTPIQGCTSCMGIMTEEGYFSKAGMALGLWALYDPDGDYGVGAASMGGNPRAAASVAVEKALAQAGRLGEIPSLIWLNCSPGQEEEVLLGIADIVGSDVPVAGGSSADNDVAGNWHQIANGTVFKDAVVISTLFPSTQIGYSFHSGYEPTQIKGRVTRANGRTLHEIDGMPAARVYNEWTNGVIADCLPSGGTILGMTTLYPIGREVGKVADIPYYKLSHPDNVTNEGSLNLFTAVNEGDEIILMTGSRESLITRAGRVAASAISVNELNPRNVAGGLVAYCAGCMLTIQDRMGSVSEEIRRAVGDKPFICVFTFGEQGCFVGGENTHGNLMISAVIFCH